MYHRLNETSYQNINIKYHKHHKFQPNTYFSMQIILLIQILLKERVQGIEDNGGIMNGYVGSK